MAEAFGVIAIVSSIVQLVDFTSKIINRLHEFQSGASEGYKSLRELQAELPLLEHALSQIKLATERSVLSIACVIALQPTITGVEECLREIDSILAKTLPNQGDGRTRRAIKSVGSVWNDTNVEKFRSTLRSYITTLTFYFATSSSTLGLTTATKLVEIRQWLSAPDPSINYQKALSLRQPNTGQWLLESDVFRRWTADASTIWLHGIPGCGKTILTSTLLEDILTNFAGDSDKAVAYFYFDFNDQTKQDPNLMIRSLLSQLSQQCVKASVSLGALFTSCNNGRNPPSPDSLLHALQSLLQEFPHVYIILDALDECRNRKQLMTIVEKLSTGQIPGLHLLCTSRREGDIETILSHILEDQRILCIQNEAVDHDIRAYVKRRLSDDHSFRKWRNDAAVRQDIETALMGGAHGMFRWVACQLDNLERCRNKKQVGSALKTLPADLDETYNRILLSIREDDIKYALQVLRWLAFSVRPMLLEEVAEIVAIDIGRCPVFDVDEILQDPMDILEVCSSLISVVNLKNATPKQFQLDQGQSAVMLAHSSVKEYLVSDRILKSRASLFSLEPLSCHQIIAKCCLHYLLQFNKSTALTEANLSMFALTDYCAQHWLGHTTISKKRDADMIALLVDLFVPTSHAYLLWICITDPENPGRRRDFSRTLESLLSPIYYASKVGVPEVVAHLIEKGADVNATGGCYGSALQTASYYGYLEIVELLIEKGADINKASRVYGSALQIASRNGHLEVLKLLIEKGADRDATSGRYGSAVQEASLNNNIETVELLIDKGADINIASGEYGSALQAASYWGHLEVLKLLIEKGADINIASGEYGTALQAASYWGHLETVELLIEKGADINKVGGKYGSALQAALYWGHLELIKLLVQEGADINIVCEDYGNALQAASYWGHAGTVQFLIEKGANVNTAGGLYNSALQAASCEGHLETVQLLINNGANVNAAGGLYNSALHAASSRGYLGIVQLLINSGAIC